MFSISSERNHRKNTFCATMMDPKMKPYKVQHGGRTSATLLDFSMLARLDRLCGLVVTVPAH
jgi:hypothetical protein